MFLGPKEFLLYPRERDPPMAERMPCEWNTRANGNVGSRGMRPWLAATKEASEALLRNAVFGGSSSEHDARRGRPDRSVPRHLTERKLGALLLC